MIFKEFDCRIAGKFHQKIKFFKRTPHEIQKFRSVCRLLKNVLTCYLLCRKISEKKIRMNDNFGFFNGHNGLFMFTRVEEPSASMCIYVYKYLKLTLNIHKIYIYKWPGKYVEVGFLLRNEHQLHLHVARDTIFWKRFFLNFSKKIEI